MITGEENEVLFWKGWLLGSGKKYEGSKPLSGRLAFMIGDKKEVVIANLGSGPLNLIGDTLPGVKVKVAASDYLADEYSKLLQELDLHPMVPVEKQDMTALTYNDKSFDIIYCTNALDHCQDPYSALTEMVRICKPGGYIYLQHIAHEGQRHHYRSLHRWNLDMTEDDDCIIWNNDPGPKTEAFFLSEIYPGFTTNLKALQKAAIVTSYVQKKKKIFLDIGAHFGESLKIALEPKYDFDKLYCFEPVPECHDLLKTFKDDRVILCEYGLWNENTTTKIYNPKSKSASLFKEKFGGEPRSEDIKLVRASDWFSKNLSVDDQVYLKINCEGAECAILDDLIKSGEYKKINVLMVDFDVRKIPSQKHLMNEMKTKLNTLGIQKIFYLDEFHLGPGTHSYFTHYWLDKSI